VNAGVGGRLFGFLQPVGWVAETEMVTSENVDFAGTKLGISQTVASAGQTCCAAGA